jgi:hypothetical protein
MRRATLAPAFVLFSILVAHTLLETARDALYLARLGPDRLAIVYLVMAALALATFAAFRRWVHLRDPRRVMLAFLALATVGSAGFAAAVTGSRVAVFGLYVWTGLVATLVVPAFWTMLDRSLRAGEAKRAFTVIGAGGVIGAVVGSGIAALLGRVTAPERLVAAGAIAYAGATAVAWLFAPRRASPEPRTRSRHAAALSARARRYVGVLVGLGLVATIALTLGDLAFKRVIAGALPADQLATAFGIVYAVLNGIGLVVQLLIAPRLLARWGIGGSLAVLPLLVAASAFGYALVGGLVAIILLELADGGLRHSLHRVGTELLYLPIPAAVRDAWKPIADAVALRGGEAIAAGLVFALGGTSLRAFVAVIAAIAVAWLVGVRITHAAYLAQLRATLRAGDIERDVPVPTLDADTLALVAESLASPDEVEVLAALDVLGERGRIPALVLYHPRAAVVHRALALLEREPRGDVERVLGHLLDHADVTIRAAALAATAGMPTYRDRRVAALEDPDPQIRAAALVGMLDDPEHGGAAIAGVARMVTGTTAERAALAKAIAHAPSRHSDDTLYELLAWREPEVVQDVVAVLARAPATVELDRLLNLLAIPQVRGAVRRVFLAAGARGLDSLIAALEDARTPLATRRHVPRTISRFGSRHAAAALVDRLGREPDTTTRHKILRALGRMRAADPALPIDRRAIVAHAARAVGDAARYITLADALAATRADTNAGKLIAEMLREEYDGAIEHAFRALGILEPRQAMRSVHDAMVGDDDARRAAAREILEACTPASIRAPLLAMLDRGAPEDRRRRLGRLAAGPFASYDALIAELLGDPSESVRCIAAYHIAERHLVAMRPQLVRLRDLAGEQPLVRHAFDQAIERLDAGP